VNCPEASPNGEAPLKGEVSPSARDFWTYCDRLVASSRVAIDRPKGSTHPRHSFVYPLD